jgi:hypothetical protein
MVPTLQSIIEVAERKGISASGYDDRRNPVEDWKRYSKGTGELGTINEVYLCRYWLQRCQLRRDVDRRGTSYGMKHVVENLYDYYVCNGAFLIACHMLPQIRVERVENTLNGFINLSARNPTFVWLNWPRGIWRADVSERLATGDWIEKKNASTW